MKRYVLVVMLATFAVAVYGQEQVLHLTLQQCISQALEKNPSLGMSKASMKSADAKLSETTSLLLPQIKLSGRAAEVSSVPEFIVPPPLNLKIFPSITEQYSLRLTLQQPIFTGLKLWKSRLIAQHALAASAFDVTKEQSEVVLQVITAYWNLYRAIKTEEVLTQTMKDVEEHLRDVSQFMKTGLATDVDVMKVRVQRSEIRRKIIEAQNAIYVATLTLETLTGIPLETKIIVTDTLGGETEKGEEYTTMSITEITQLAKRQRAEFLAMMERRSISEEQVGIAKSGWYPQVMLQANYDYARPNQRILPLKDRWDGTWDVGIVVQWNIWDWLTPHYQSVQAEQSLRQTEFVLRQIEDKIALEVAQYYYAVRAEREKLVVAQEEATMAEETYRVASQKFKAGLLSSTELTDAETSVLQAKLFVTQASVDYKIALAKFYKAIGKL